MIIGTRVIDSSFVYADYKETGNPKIYATIKSEISFQIGKKLYVKNVSNTITIDDPILVKSMLKKGKIK